MSFFFFESRLGKRQFDCSEAEQGAEGRPPFIDQSPTPRTKRRGVVALPGAPGDPRAASLQGAVGCAGSLRRPVLWSGLLPPLPLSPALCLLLVSWLVTKGP